MSKPTPEPPSPIDKFRFAWMMALFLLLGCALVSVPNIDTIRGALFIGPQAYKTTTGTITRSDLQRRGGKFPGYLFDIRYTYLVNGRLYESNQISFSKRASSDKSFCEVYTRKYPRGKTVDVYYKGDEPTFAVLEPSVVGSNRKVFTTVLVLSALSIVTLTWCAFKIHRLKHARPEEQ